MAGRAGAWDAQTVTKLQEERAAILSRLQALPDEGETAQTEGRKKADSLAVQQAVNALSVNADALRSKIGAKRSELANVEAALGTAAPAAAALAASIAAKSPEVRHTVRNDLIDSTRVCGATVLVPSLSRGREVHHRCRTGRL